MITSEPTGTVQEIDALNEEMGKAFSRFITARAMQIEVESGRMQIGGNDLKGKVKTRLLQAAKTVLAEEYDESLASMHFTFAKAIAHEPG